MEKKYEWAYGTFGPVGRTHPEWVLCMICSKSITWDERVFCVRCGHVVDLMLSEN